LKPFEKVQGLALLVMVYIWNREAKLSVVRVCFLVRTVLWKISPFSAGCC